MKFFYLMNLIAVLLSLSTSAIQGQTVTDFDGNIYQTVTIGNQVWMRANLKSLHYSDGTVITEVWSYKNSDSLAAIYGRIYSWNAAMRGAASSDLIPSGVQGVCPSGWHLPGSAEWSILANRYGGEFQAGAKLKEAGTLHWDSPNTGATNESGFTALPGGFHSQPDGGFCCMGATGGWWTSYNSGGYVYSIYMGSENVYAIQFGSFMGPGYSYNDMAVRCLKDGGSTTINEIDNVKIFSIYPNPANSYITILLESNMKAVLSIYGLEGKLMLQRQLNQQETIIDIGDFPAGLYIVSVRSPQGINQKRIIKTSS
jgi:uncharacterized protein (TIGR02145 family)